MRRTSIGLVGTLVMWGVAAAVILPIVVMVLTSLKSDVEIASYPPGLLPNHPTFGNYVELFRIVNFAQFFANSAAVSTAAAILTASLAAPAAYAMTRYQSLGTDAVGLFGLAAFMLPGILVAVPIFRIVYRLHLIDSLPVLAIIYTAFFLPLAVWQLRSYFAGVPREVEEAALVDGATRFRAFYSIVLPQVMTGLIGTSALTFSLAWNEYLFASLLLFTPHNQTLSVGMANTLSGAFGVYSWGVLLAGGTLMTIPVLLAFLYVQGRLVGGLGGGAVKG